MWFLACYLVVLVSALHERLKARSIAMVQAASAFGLTWCGLVIAYLLRNLGPAQSAG